MNLVFGNILRKYRLIEHFCLSQQKETETVAEWSCRLEDMLSQLKEKDNICSMNQATMLRERFFHGLFSDKVKTCLRHLFDRGESYEQLLLSGKSAELEYSKQGKSSKANISSIQQTIPSNIELSKKLDSLIDGMNSLKSKVRALEDNKFFQQQQNPRSTHAGATQFHKSSQGQHRSQQWRPCAPPRQIFKGNCHKCGEAGHKQSSCPLN